MDVYANVRFGSKADISIANRARYRKRRECCSLLEPGGLHGNPPVPTRISAVQVSTLGRKQTLAPVRASTAPQYPLSARSGRQHVPKIRAARSITGGPSLHPCRSHQRRQPQQRNNILVLASAHEYVAIGHQHAYGKQ